MTYDKKQEIDSIYKDIRSKKYSELEEWEKYLEKERVKKIEKRKQREKWGFVEIPFGDYLENMGN